MHRSCPIRDLGPVGAATFGRTLARHDARTIDAAPRPAATTWESTMCTVLITYSTPQPPSETTVPVPGAPDEVGAPASPAMQSLAAEPSFAATTAGIDEAIAAAVADELTRAGHRVACRPSVAVTTTNGFDLVVAVHRLRVSHSNGGTPRPVDPDDPESAAAERSRAGRGGRGPRRRRVDDPDDVVRRLARRRRLGAERR